MKSTIVLAIIIIAVSISLVFSSCKKSLPDPVTGVPPVHQWDGATVSTIDSISTAQPEQARQLIASSNLGQRILDYLGIKGAVKMEYYIVKASSKDTVKVLDKHDNILEGILTKDHLLVRVTPKGGKAQMFFVRCMNGMVSSIDGSTFLGEEIYILAIGEGPMHHGATYAQVWNMAGRYHLILTAYRTDKKGHQHRVRNAQSLDDFKQLASKYGIVRINSLQPGDRLRKNFDGSWDYLK